jgi:hypothetical protein
MLGKRFHEYRSPAEFNFDATNGPAQADASRRAMGSPRSALRAPVGGLRPARHVVYGPAVIRRSAAILTEFPMIMVF